MNGRGRSTNMHTYGVHVLHGARDLDANRVTTRIAAEPWLMKNGTCFLCALRRQRHHGNLRWLPFDDCECIVLSIYSSYLLSTSEVFTYFLLQMRVQTIAYRMVTRPLHRRAATHTYQECRLPSDLTTACVQNNLERQSACFRLDTFVHKYE
jgi:hypothetical protein